MLPPYRQPQAGRLAADRPVAYFCAEYGMSDLLPIYSGGLGVLAGDIYQEAAEEGFPLVAVGLYYQSGFFHQAIDCEGQVEYRQKIDAFTAGLELMKGEDGDTLLVEVPIADRMVYAQVWRLLTGTTPLYLLDTDHWRNSEEDRRITDELYGGGPELRIQQELVLGIGGYRALKALGITPSLYHMNEGHSAFLGLELIAETMKASGDDAHACADCVRDRLVFTNHTLVPAGNDLFPPELVRSFLARFSEESGLSLGFILTLGANPENPGDFLMTALGMRLAGASNAVSRLHAKEAEKLWPDHPLTPITNGVYLPGWIAPEMQQLLDEAAPEWRSRSDEPRAWQGLRSLPLDRLWRAHEERKRQMLDETYARTGIRLDPQAFTVVWARRFAAYKRPHLLFSDVVRLKEAFLFSKERPVQVLIAGKAHPEDAEAKELIEEITRLADYELQHRVVFLNDYSIYLAKILVAGADLWLNTPRLGLEASGTSGMKAGSNGVIQCTVADGWAAEVDWRGIGYVLPADQSEDALYELLEKKILPTYYKRNGNGLPEQWAGMMRDSIMRIAPAFCARRLLSDYKRSLYGPLAR